MRDNLPEFVGFLFMCDMERRELQQRHLRHLPYDQVHPFQPSCAEGSFSRLSPILMLVANCKTGPHFELFILKLNLDF